MKAAILERWEKLTGWANVSSSSRLVWHVTRHHFVIHQSRHSNCSHQKTTSGQRILTSGSIADGFIVALDCFYRRPMGTLEDSLQGNPDVIATLKCPFPLGIWTPPSNTVPSVNPIQHPKWHLDRFSRFGVIRSLQTVCNSRPHLAIVLLYAAYKVHHRVWDIINQTATALIHRECRTRTHQEMR